MQELLKRLKKLYPVVRCSLDYRTPYELLVATVLSAQCTDVRVNRVTPALFKRFGTPEKMAHATQSEIEELIRSTGFFRQKAKSLREAAQTLVRDYSGKVPNDLESLASLRGVGRKTANVVLGNAFGIPALPVDTHVGRLARRLGLSRSLNPVKVESDLMRLLPAEEWTSFSHRLIEHGRAVCMARTPQCASCALNSVCLKQGVKNKKTTPSE